MTEKGIYCEPGDFYIDPRRPVRRAIVTHAHADHAFRGSEKYLCARPGLALLRIRLGNYATIETIGYGERLYLNGVQVSLHPAGHILGSAQVRIEYRGRVFVFSGDYKIQEDPTCSAIEVLRCHTFITESTFGLPLYRWPESEKIMHEIFVWWQDNQKAGKASILFAYSVGKAQRLLMSLDTSPGPVFVHRQIEDVNRRYRECGIGLPRTLSLETADKKTAWSRALIIAPPSANRNGWHRRFGDSSTGFASGWMCSQRNRKHRGIDHGFVFSDHADWPGLMSTIEATGAEEVWVTHGEVSSIVRALNEKGLDARPLDTCGQEEE